VRSLSIDTSAQAWIAPLPVARALVRRPAVAVGEVLP
jgi:hypothetical protein